MTDKKHSLGYLKELLTPGLNGVNSKFQKNYSLSIEGKKLKLSDGRTVVDDAKCKGGKEQMRQLNEMFRTLRQEGEDD